VYRKLEFDADHLAVIGTFKVHLKANKKHRGTARRYKVELLESPTIEDQYDSSVTD